ncbi:MAG: tRNA-uridine aminocarboxypropyltransferase [Sandaracinus sp.]
MRTRALPRCPTCGIFVGLCDCASLPRLPTRTEIVVVVHRFEAFKSSSTSKLAVRMLANATLVVREGRVEPTPAPVGSYVLFPNAAAIPIEEARARGLMRLVVPDGNWPQAGKMARRDPLCAGLPTVALTSTRRSAYGLRKSQRPNALCTLEAIAEALRVLEGDEVPDAMHEAFAHWMHLSQQIRSGSHAQRALPQALAALALDHERRKKSGEGR